MRILGINAYHGDASSALLENGLLKAAVEEERFNRIKHWAGLPVAAIRNCLEQCGVERIEHVAVSRNPRIHLGKKLARVAARPKLWQKALGRAKNLVSVNR